MFAAFAARTDAEAPLDALEIGEVEPGATPADWVEVAVRAAALNHHDVWSLRGVGLPSDRLPMILGCDAAGVTAEGREVIVYPVITDPGFTGSGSDARSEALAAVGALPGDAGHHGTGAGRQPDREAGGAVLRRGGLPADGVVDGVPDALRRFGAHAGSDRTDPGRGRGSGHRLGDLGSARRTAGLGDVAGPGSGRAGGRVGCPRRFRQRRAGCRSESTR